MNKVFKNYTNLLIPGSFSGLSGFKNNSGVAKAEKYLPGIETYTLHKTIKKKFKKRQTLASKIDEIWQVDLIDLKKYSTLNKNYKYLLTCIDVFSRFAWVEPLKNKSSNECQKAFEKIFTQDNRIPKVIYSDWGNEFKGSCLKYFKKIGIFHIDSKSIHKAAMVERFNRTLKEKMFRYFTFSKSKKYIDALPYLVNNYNNSFHTFLKTSPASINKNNEEEIRKKLYSNLDEYIVNFAFKKGDYVREVVSKKVFEKGYTPNWSKEDYVISELIPTNPPTYKIKGLDGKEFEWKYYKQELQKVSPLEFPYDSYEILGETKNKYKVRQLNSQDIDKEIWIDKNDYHTHTRSKLSE